MRSLFTYLFTLVCCNHIAFQSFGDTFGIGGNSFTLDFVGIGDPGNVSDTTWSLDGLGSVAYSYRIAKYEVTRDAVEKTNAAGELGIDLVDMSALGGNSPDKPAAEVTWNEAARFVNYLNTSRGFPAAYKFAVLPGESGYDANQNIELWKPTDAGFNPLNPFRNSLAHYFIPSADEWHKAAYYNPSSRSYSQYPVGLDTPPIAVASGTTAGTEVYLQPGRQGPAVVTQAGGLGAYGVMGMGGNVWEWDETAGDNTDVAAARGSRGGDWHLLLSYYFDSSAKVRGTIFPQDEYQSIGIRVASIPEPHAGLILTSGLVFLGNVRRKMRLGIRNSF